jgi:hypothetical protein
MIWKTDEKLMNEFDVAKNIEATIDKDGYIEIRIVRSTEGEDPISLMKILSPSDAVSMGVALIRATGRGDR